MQYLPPALQALGAYPQFVCWVAVPNAKGKFDKIPVDAMTGETCSAIDPNHQYTFDVAAGRAATMNTGVGFVFTQNDPFFFVDIDGCFSPETGRWSDLAIDVYRQFPGAATEKSYSGTGVHIFGQYTEKLEHAKKNVPLGMELYTEDRFVALTGVDCTGQIALDHTDNLRRTIDKWFTPLSAEGNPDGWTTEPVPEWNGYTDDDDLIAAALKAKSANVVFGNVASFEALWNNDEDELAKFYPPDSADTYDRSSADAALALHLMFWTGRDCERVRRLMFRSGLVRQKWERANYIEPTVYSQYAFHVSKGFPVYTAGPERRDPNALITEPQRLKAGGAFMSSAHQPDYFQGCVYIIETRQIWSTSLQMLMTPDQFSDVYGGYTFMLDTENNKKTDDAFKCFTRSQAWLFPKVHAVSFRPDMEPGNMYLHEGRKYVNTYTPVPTESKEGDASPFLNHIAKLLPAEQDQQILLAYLAALKQYPGKKFQWAVVIQGTEGNGKSIIGEFISRAIGERLSYQADSADLGNKFNAWMQTSLLGLVEEIYVPEHRAEITEILKRWVTGKRLQIQKKRVDQYTADILVNFIFFTNYPDAIRKTANDRRYAIMYCAQQSYEDILNDGMDGNYFVEFMKWAERGGYAIVNNFLQTYDIPNALNPATECVRAPKTSAHEQVLQGSMGRVEQIVSEQIEFGNYGFANGWLSSVMLSRLLQEDAIGRRIAPRTVAKIVKDLGFVPHPGLPEGRTSHPPQREGARTRLYVRPDSPARLLTDPRAVVEAYERAQSGEARDAFAVIEGQKPA